MTNPPIPFLGLKMAKKGVFRAFLMSAVPISGFSIVYGSELFVNFFSQTVLKTAS